MPVRGTTAWHRRKIVILEGVHEGDKISCAWDDCDRDGDARYILRVDHGSPGHPYRVTYAFCSERHLLMWRYGHRRYGNLP